MSNQIDVVTIGVPGLPGGPGAGFSPVQSVISANATARLAPGAFASIVLAAAGGQTVVFNSIPNDGDIVRVKLQCLTTPVAPKAVTLSGNGNTLDDPGNQGACATSVINSVAGFSYTWQWSQLADDWILL